MTQPVLAAACSLFENPFLSSATDYPPDVKIDYVEIGVTIAFVVHFFALPVLSRTYSMIHAKCTLWQKDCEKQLNEKPFLRVLYEGTQDPNPDHLREAFQMFKEEWEEFSQRSNEESALPIHPNNSVLFKDEYPQSIDNFLVALFKYLNTLSGLDLEVDRFTRFFFLVQDLENPDYPETSIKDVEGRVQNIIAHVTGELVC